jgi:hypothetical protein
VIRIRHTVSGFLTDLLSGSSIIALCCGHLEFAAAGATGVVALLIKDYEYKRRDPCSKS